MAINTPEINTAISWLDMDSVCLAICSGAMLSNSPLIEAIFNRVKNCQLGGIYNNNPPIVCRKPSVKSPNTLTFILNRFQSFNDPTVVIPLFVLGG